VTENASYGTEAGSVVMGASPSRRGYLSGFDPRSVHA